MSRDQPRPIDPITSERLWPVRFIGGPLDGTLRDAPESFIDPTWYYPIRVDGLGTVAHRYDLERGPTFHGFLAQYRGVDER